jgi:hypothetical protein
LKTLILDCPSYPGNSGGPVIRYVSDGLHYEYSLVGMVIQFIPYEEVWVNRENKLVNREWSNSGYSVAISADDILEVVATMN